MQKARFPIVKLKRILEIKLPAILKCGNRCLETWKYSLQENSSDNSIKESSTRDTSLSICLSINVSSYN
jgi:hypothetical protein